VTSTIFGIRSNISLKLLELETTNLIHGFVWAMPSRRTNNFPESRRGLDHVNHTIFGSTVGTVILATAWLLVLIDPCSPFIVTLNNPNTKLAVLLS